MDGRGGVRRRDGVVSVAEACGDALLRGLRVAAFGGELLADASLEDLSRYTVNGKIRGVDIQNTVAGFGTSIPYDGFVSGTLNAEGDLTTPGAQDVFVGNYTTNASSQTCGVGAEASFTVNVKPAP